jgi:protein-tyrosine phosphatase
VYIHCKYGIEESATVLLTFICLSYYVSVEEAAKFISKWYPKAQPNVSMVQKITN